jgi:hypothetical protein
MDPKTIASALGPPTVSQKAGDVRITGDTKRVCKDGLWAKVIDADSQSADTVLDQLLSELPAEASRAKELPGVTRVDIDVFVAVRIGADQRLDLSMELTAGALAKLSSIGAPMQITIAGVPDDGEMRRQVSS